MSDAQRMYDAVRSRLDHEDNLIVQRLSWMLGSQSFLFTGYAIALSAGQALAADRMRVLLWVMPGVGIATSLLIYAGILAALVAMRRLATDFAARVPEASGLGLPPIRSSEGLLRAGLAAPLGLPVLFVVAWVCLLAVR